MADTVKFNVQVVDKATAELKKIDKSVKDFDKTGKNSAANVKKWAQDNQANFQKMALIGTAAFVAVGAGILKVTKSAAEAEGTRNKFNTVFAEGAGDMTDFINDIRTRMPVATDTIARMAADIQDLLVPIGLSRELGAEMTQGFLEAANAIGAFNDVDPSQVLDAIKSGAIGSSEPLAKFGVDARVTALETKALQMGLLEAGQSFAKLSPEVANQIRVQALLAQVMDQSSDAIAGFDDNADSLIFRQMEMKATFEDLSSILGQSFMPIIDNIVTMIIPLVRGFAEWAGENQKLVTIIGIGALAIAGLVATLGTIGLILPSVIGGFGAMVTAVKAVGVAMTFLAANPIGAVIALLGLLVILVVKNWDTISEKITQAVDWIWTRIEPFVTWLTNAWTVMSNAIRQVWDNLRNWVNEATGGYLDYLQAFFGAFVALFKGDFDGFVAGITNAWNIGLDMWRNLFTNIMTTIRETGRNIRDGIKTIFQNAINWIGDAFKGAKDLINDAFNFMLDGISGLAKNIFNGVISTIEGFVNKAIGLLNKIISAANNIPGISIPMIAQVSIGRLAKGGIAGEGFWGGSPLGDMMQHFATGGFVRGPAGIDNVPAMLTAGEVVLNAAQQRNLASQLSRGGGGPSIVVHVSGNNFYGDDEEFAEKIGDTILDQFKNHAGFESF